VGYVRPALLAFRATFELDVPILYAFVDTRSDRWTSKRRELDARKENVTKMGHTILLNSDDPYPRKEGILAIPEAPIGVPQPWYFLEKSMILGDRESYGDRPSC
jgi:hypothetical protein